MSESGIKLSTDRVLMLVIAAAVFFNTGLSALKEDKSETDMTVQVELASLKAEVFRQGEIQGREAARFNAFMSSPWFTETMFDREMVRRDELAKRNYEAIEDVKRSLQETKDEVSGVQFMLQKNGDPK